VQVVFVQLGVILSYLWRW